MTREEWEAACAAEIAKINTATGNLTALTTNVPDAPDPPVEPEPIPPEPEHPIIEPPPIPTTGKIIWLSTHIGASLQTQSVQDQYKAIRPSNSERCDFYSSAFDANTDGKFDGETATFKNRCASFGAGRIAPITIDWESYSGGNMGRDLGGINGTTKQRAAITEHLKVIAAIKKYCPKAPIGIYSTPNTSSGYASRLNPDAWWLAQEDSLAQIWEAVDYVSPARYCAYAVSDTAHWSDAKDIKLCKNEADLCNRIKAKHPKLQILPYYQVIYRNGTVAYNNKLIPLQEWYNHIKRFNDTSGDGAVWWSGSGSPTLPVAHLSAMRNALDGKPM